MAQAAIGGRRVPVLTTAGRIREPKVISQRDLSDLKALTISANVSRTRMRRLLCELMDKQKHGARIESGELCWETVLNDAANAWCDWDEE